MPDQDVRKVLTSSSPHRLPTISASDALLSLNSAKSRAISTGLPKLDADLRGSQAGPSPGNALKGIPRGYVTEIYGPPASGKTCFAIQMTSNALQAGDRVVWVDTASPLPGPRLKEILLGHKSPKNGEPPSSPTTPRTMDELLQNLTHVQTPTLPHLLSLFVQPPQNFPPSKSSLIIVDSVSSLFAATFPKSSDFKSKLQEGEKRKDNVQWAASRRWGVAGELLSKMCNMAATKNLVILVIEQTATQMRGLAGAMLCSAISGTTWDAGIHSRIVLFRDLVTKSDNEIGVDMQQMRFAAVLKAGGKALDEKCAAKKMTPFLISDRGIQEVGLDTVEPTLSQVPPQPSQASVLHNRPKRKRDEIPDSEDEDDILGSDEEYNWRDDEAQLTAMLEEDEYSAAEAEFSN